MREDTRGTPSKQTFIHNVTLKQQRAVGNRHKDSNWNKIKRYRQYRKMRMRAQEQPKHNHFLQCYVVQDCTLSKHHVIRTTIERPPPRRAVNIFCPGFTKTFHQTFHHHSATIPPPFHRNGGMFPNVSTKKFCVCLTTVKQKNFTKIWKVIFVKW